VLIAAFTLTGSLPSDILMAIVLLSMGGFTCAELGKRIPIIRNIGAAAIFATFIPSFLAFHHLLPAPILRLGEGIHPGLELPLTCSSPCIIVGSILGMDRGVLVQGFLKIFIPLATGSVVAGVVGTLVGVLLGLGAYHTFFFVVVPIMAGGVGEGAIPLSIGYAQILQQPQGDLFAQVAAAGDARQPDGDPAVGHASTSSARNIPPSPARGGCSRASTTSSPSRKTLRMSTWT